MTVRRAVPDDARGIAEVQVGTWRVAYTGLVPDDVLDTNLGVRVAEVAAIYVLPDHWRRGVGSALMAATTASLREDGYSAVVLWVLEANERARAFNAARGFAPDGAERMEPRLQLPEVRYRATLSAGSLRAMRTVFLGTSEFAVAVLQRLAASPHRPALVVTRPDKPRGRGRQVAPPPAAEAARELGIEVLQPPSVNDDEARTAIAAAAPESVCVCAYGGLIKDPLLSAYPMLNVHPSLLPRWRGAAPIERALMAGDVDTGVSIMRLVEALDAGPVCAQRSEPVHGHDTYGTLAPRLQRISGELLVEVLDDQPACRPQDDAHATYAEKIGPEDRLLDPGRTPPENERVVRALEPHIGARIARDDEQPLRVRAAAIRGDVEDLAPGRLAERDGRLLWGCAEGALELVEVQPPGGRPMDAAAFLRGHAL